MQELPHLCGLWIWVSPEFHRRANSTRHRAAMSNKVIIGSDASRGTDYQHDLQTLYAVPVSCTAVFQWIASQNEPIYSYCKSAECITVHSTHSTRLSAPQSRILRGGSGHNIIFVWTSRCAVPADSDRRHAFGSFLSRRLRFRHHVRPKRVLLLHFTHHIIK